MSDFVVKKRKEYIYIFAFLELAYLWLISSNWSDMNQDTNFWTNLLSWLILAGIGIWFAIVILSSIYDQIKVSEEHLFIRRLFRKTVIVPYWEIEKVEYGICHYKYSKCDMLEFWCVGKHHYEVIHDEVIGYYDLADYFKMMKIPEVTEISKAQKIIRFFTRR